WVMDRIENLKPRKGATRDIGFQVVSPFQGSVEFTWHPKPRALPWADLFCPFGAYDMSSTFKIAAATAYTSDQLSTAWENWLRAFD
ncbi:MAG TPA: hypothetical protein VHB77_20300, partial [Planctomycetaceae bacterium]|nr:hypothetical protein [Planctomycetaceae bacterium]